MTIKLDQETKDTLGFGGDLREWRMKRGLTQKKLAKLLGIPVITLQTWEHGRYEPQHKLILQMALKELARKLKSAEARKAAAKKKKEPKGGDVLL